MSDVVSVVCDRGVGDIVTIIVSKVSASKNFIFKKIKKISEMYLSFRRGDTRKP